MRSAILDRYLSVIFLLLNWRSHLAPFRKQGSWNLEFAISLALPVSIPFLLNIAGGSNPCQLGLFLFFPSLSLCGNYQPLKPCLSADPLSFYPSLDF